MGGMTTLTNGALTPQRLIGRPNTTVRTGGPKAQGAMAQLTHLELIESQQQTLTTPRRRYGLGAKLLFTLLDTVYSKKRTLSKFKVIELVARVPYQAWEQVSYIAITHTHDDPQFARRIFDRVSESRAQEDNEQWHLLILEEMITNEGIKEGRFKFTVIPQALAFVYYQLSWLLYVLHPAWSYRLNADFEDHAEHEYAHLVHEHPEWEVLPFLSAFADDYAHPESVADLFRQIGYDERVHKDESIAAMAQPRFA
jgi:ubiquinol oxidase